MCLCMQNCVGIVIKVYIENNTNIAIVDVCDCFSCMSLGGRITSR